VVVISTPRKNADVREKSTCIWYYFCKYFI